jgi:signal transduction histidine kinase
MNQREGPRGYQGGYLIGFMLIGVVALRALLFYQGEPILPGVILLIAIYALFYSLEPWLAIRFQWHPYIYFPLQTALVLTLSNLHPFLDFLSVLYFPLCIQVFRTFSRRAAISWGIFFVLLLSITLIPGMGWLEGSARILLDLASGTFLISYDFLYTRTQADRAESQKLLANLQIAHQELKGYTAQAEELAATRERNRLARELHDSVGQIIFSITLTSQSARLFLEREPARVPQEIARLQTMTSSALNQLRSLIAELRPH